MLNPFEYFQHCRIIVFSGLICFSFLSPFSDAMAQGDLLINPKRVLFEGQKRSQEINLANIGNDTARYLISFIQIRMKDDGNFEQITQPDSGQNFSDKYLRVFPRSVTLAPNEAQVVKVQVSQSNKMLPGEYRSHLYFRAVPKEDLLGEKSQKVDTAGVSVRIIPVFGISIPVIIRIGEYTAGVSLSNLKVETLPDLATILKIRFNRTGNMSVYGDLILEHISGTGKITKVGFIKGISVYTPNLVRDVKVKLDDKSGIDYRSGSIKVTYTTSGDGKSEKLAAQLLLN